MLRCSVSTQLDWPKSVRVSGIVVIVYHYQPVTVAVVIIRGVSGAGQCRSHGGASLGKAKLVGTVRRPVDRVRWSSV